MKESARCSHFTICGGCTLQHISYAEQIEKKSELLKEFLIPLSEHNDSKKIEQIKSQPFEYRNRIRLKIKKGQKGFSANKSNDFVAIDYCHLIEKRANQQLNKLEGSLKDKFFKDIKEVECFFTKEGHCYLTFHTNKRKLDRKKLSEIHDKIGRNNFSLILKNNLESLQSGDPWIKLKVADYDFEFSGLSFFQTNRFILDSLIGHYETFIEEGTYKTALDLFCGVGLLSLALAKRKIKVIGFEVNQESIMAAKRNSQINGLENLCDFKVRNLSGRLPEIDSLSPEIMVIDPPRSGLHRDLRLQIAEKSSIQSIIYLSCNPKTLSRDLLDLCKGGFKIKKSVLLDMFPQTNHIESLVLLTRR